MNNYNWKNVLRLEGTIDPATIEKAKKIVDLEEKIEWNLNNIKNLPEDCNTRRCGEQVIKMYAEQYKELTGDFYRRDWK